MLDEISLIDVKTDDTTDYKETSLLLVFPKCSGKCNGCQNWQLFNIKNIRTYKIKSIIELYNSLNTHKSIVCAGLEPFDSFDELLLLISKIVRLEKSVDFIIYTGYNKEEIDSKIKLLLETFILNVKNRQSKIIIKYGRYDKTKNKKWYSKVLGVGLATSNQYVIMYSVKNKDDIKHMPEMNKIEERSFCVSS